MTARARSFWTISGVRTVIIYRGRARTVGRRINPACLSTRNLLHLGGTITYTPDAINVALDLLTTPKITRALSLLTEQLNTNPPRTPGGPAPSPTPSPDDQRSTVAATRLPDVWDRVEEDDLLRGGDRRLLSALSPRDRVW